MIVLLSYSFRTLALLAARPVQKTPRKPNAHTSRLACCPSAGVASRLACCQWPLCAIPPVTPTDRQTARSTTALPGRRIASLCPRLRSSWRDNQLRVILRTFGKDPYGAPLRSYVEKHRCSHVMVEKTGVTATVGNSSRGQPGIKRTASRISVPDSFIKPDSILTNSQVSRGQPSIRRTARRIAYEDLANLNLMF